MNRSIVLTGILCLVGGAAGPARAAPGEAPRPEAAAEARFAESISELREEYLATLEAVRKGYLADLAEAHRQAVEVLDDAGIAKRILGKIREVRSEVEARGRFVPPRVPEFEVIAAHYGTVGRWNDVTGKLRALADGRGLSIAVTNPRLWGDPASYYKKALVVTYVFRGRVHTAIGGEGSRLRLPHADPEAAMQSVKQGLAERTARIRSGIAGVRASSRAALDEAVATARVDVLRKAVLDQRRAEAVLPQLDELTAFLDRHAFYATELGFDEARAFAEGRRTEVVALIDGLAAGFQGMREVRMSIPASSDWRSLEVTVREGDLVAFEAEGRWSAGKYAGSCDASGLSGERYACHSTHDDLRHACLLVRVGRDHLLWAERNRGVVRSPAAGRVEGRCNDDTYPDNSGQIRVRLLVVPREILSAGTASGR